MIATLLLLDWIEASMKKCFKTQAGLELQIILAHFNTEERTKGSSIAYTNKYGLSRKNECNPQ